MNNKLSLCMVAQIRKISTFFPKQKNHYESLGISKTATQADVKSAYYELSKVYHPDKNQGHTEQQRENHQQKFRDITEAYEVLGNVQSRRMYDKGWLGVTSHSTSHTSQQDPLHNFYKSRETRTRPPPPGGRQPIYDFDEWSKMHYGEAVRRKQEMRERRAFYAYQKQHQADNNRMEWMIFLPLFIVFLCTAFVRSFQTYDVVRYGPRTRPVGNSNNIKEVKSDL